MNYLRRVQIKVECSQLHEMAPAFGVRALGTALVVISGFYRPRRQEMRWASFPSLPEYQSGLAKRSQAPAPQRLRRSDLCKRFNYLTDSYQLFMRSTSF